MGPIDQTAQTAQLEKLLVSLRAQTRVCLFLDNSNLFHVIRGMGMKKLDYIRLRDFLADGRTTDVRFYYSEPQSENDSVKRASRERFYRFLEDKVSFNMIRLPLRERSGYDAAASNLVNHLRRSKLSDDDILRIADQRYGWLQQITGNELVFEEKGLDCEIVYDMARLSRTGSYSNFILVAGDEDYARTVRKIRDDTGITVELAFFGGNACSKALQRAASSFLDLNDIPNLFSDYRSEEF
jgi:uncharacterized LabA/DUF88 family protein